MNLKSNKHYINSASTYETLDSFRDRIKVSENLTNEETAELLTWCDIRQSEIWWDTLHGPQILPVYEKSASKKIRPAPRRR